MRKTSLWNRFQGVVYGSLLGEGLAITTGKKLNRLYKMRMNFFEHFVYSRTLEWNILENEQEIIQDLTLGEIGILIIPVILFFHENQILLNHHLNSLGLYLGKTKENIAILQYWSKVIGLAIRGAEWDESLFFKLEQKEGEGKILLSSLNCFLSCRDDLRLSLLLAYKEEDNFPLITALTGILLGAYNGKNSFPISWRLIIQDQQHPEVVILARFFAAWCGVNSPDNWHYWDVTAVL